MLSTQDFAQRVWVSLEDIRERLAVLETEARYTRCQLQRLEAGLHDHTANHRHGDSDGAEPGDGDLVTIHFNRKLLGGSGIVGGVLAVAIGVGKALGWW